MRNWPSWIPDPNAWTSAILLILLMRGLAVVLRAIVQMGDFLIHPSPKLGFFLWMFASLSPILLIAVVHHWLYRFLDHYSPTTRSPEMVGTEGFFPSLMSWWEGLYGWMVLALSALASNALLIIVLPTPKVIYNIYQFWAQTGNLLTVSTLLQVIAAAYLYHFEYLVRQHLLSVDSINRANQ
jgi:hypothetical protein